jgi:hypothetical protein
MMWHVKRHEKSLVGTNYIVVIGDSPRVAARFIKKNIKNNYTNPVHKKQCHAVLTVDLHTIGFKNKGS